MYFSNPSEPIFSAMNMFPTQGQQQPRQHFPVTSQLNKVHPSIRRYPLFLHLLPIPRHFLLL